MCVGIGTYARSLQFCEHVGFPREYLFSDEQNSVYDSLNLVKSTPYTLFTDVNTPLALLKRLRTGNTKYLNKAVNNWRFAMWIPPKLEQGLQQGGCCIFRGRESIFQYKDPSVASHVDLNEIIKIALTCSIVE